jgi:electron transport complex protein RnfG
MLLLTAVVAVSVTVLTFTDSITRDRIEAQQDAKIKTLLLEMFPEMGRFELDNDIYTIFANGDTVGYAFIAIGNGYGGDIDILVGLEDETTIKGITIVSHAETPGLGTRVAEPSFTDMFSGVSIEDVALSRDGGNIDAITSSTISSTAVVEAVRTTAMEKVKLLKD